MKKRLLTSIAIAGAAAVALAGCAPADGGSESKGDITIGVFNGWAEDIATSYVWKQVLEEQGYKVTLESADAGAVFLALSKGQYDVNFDAWLPGTHKEYWEQYGDDLEDLGAWYQDAPLTIAVPADSPIDSLDELAAHADEFGNRIVGIEPGAGETGIVQDSVIPAYGLEGLDFQTSSTPAMLAELKRAIDSGENIAVTLWKPHWAYGAFPLKDLADPKGALGEPDHINTIARTGFSADFPEVTEWFKSFSFDDELLADLESKMFSDDSIDESQYPSIVKDWLAEHQDFADSLIG